MAINNWRVGQALLSVSRLNEILPELTEEEVLACLELEARSRRRHSVLTRLISRAARLNELRYVESLNHKYYPAHLRAQLIKE